MQQQRAQGSLALDPGDVKQDSVACLKVPHLVEPRAPWVKTELLGGFQEMQTTKHEDFLRLWA